MGGAWGWSAAVGVLFGVGVFAVAFVPTLVLQYRRYGAFEPGRMLAAAALAVYLVVLAFYTVFPLPDPNWCSVNTPPPAALTPLHSVGDIERGVEGATVTEALRSAVVLQVVLNVVLFVPFGVLVRSLLEVGRVATVAAGLATSLLIETVQGTGIFGLVGCAYRVADVDDLVTNTSGTAIGVLLAPLVGQLLPRRRELERQRSRPRRVSRWRRVSAMLVDVTLVLVVSTVLGVAYRVVVHFGLGRAVPGDDDWFGRAVPLLAMALVVVVASTVGTGASPGQRVVWLRPAPGSARWRLVLRALVGTGGWALLVAAAAVPPLVGTATGHGLDVAARVVLVVSAVAVLVDPRARGLSYRLTGLRLVDARAADRGRENSPPAVSRRSG